MTQQLKHLFEQWSGENLVSTTPLPQSGSYRQYFRMISANHQAIGVYNPDKNENHAFITFTKHFLKHLRWVFQFLSWLYLPFIMLEQT